MITSVKKLISSLFLFIGVIGLYSCDDDPILSPEDDPDPIIGCEAADIYDWDSLSFSTTFGEDETMWLAFEVESMAIYKVELNATGFECSIYDQCSPDNMAVGDSLLNFFVTTGLDEIDMGVVAPGTYYLEMYNTRNRADFDFTINIYDIILGCTDDNAINYNEEANVDSGDCMYNNCDTDYYIDAYQDWASNLYFPMVLDCDGNCSPESWIGDGWCDDGAYGVYDENGEVVPINLMCEELEWDLGDCEEVVEGCPEGQIEDCNDNCAPADWVGDGYCDDGTYQFGGNAIYFNCEEFNNDEGDCDSLMRSQPLPKYPSGRVPYIN